MVAPKAASDYVLPGLIPSLDDGDDVVEGQIFGATLFAAVLAGVVIAGIDVGA